jgi:hypothetical protein
VKVFSSNNDKSTSLVLGSAPGNAKYTSPEIKKEILDLIATNVQASTRKKIVMKSSACLLMKHKMDRKERKRHWLFALLTTVVNRELFFDLVHVRDTTARTIKGELCATLVQILDVQNIRQ